MVIHQYTLYDVAYILMRTSLPLLVQLIPLQY